jgi:hypothetical protein
LFQPIGASAAVLALVKAKPRQSAAAMRLALTFAERGGFAVWSEPRKGHL